MDGQLFVAMRYVEGADLLVDAAGHAYLTDFGVSKQLGGVTTDTGRLVGSLDYLAPEQIAGRRVEPATDPYTRRAQAAVRQRPRRRRQPRRRRSRPLQDARRADDD